MTKQDNPKNKSYRSVNLYKYNNIIRYNLYLYIEIIKDVNNKIILMKYLILNGSSLNFIPTEPINLPQEIKKNTLFVDLNQNVRLNIIFCKNLYNVNIMKYKFNYSYLSPSITPIKTFFMMNDLRYKINNNSSNKLNLINTKSLDESYLSILMSNLGI